MIERRKFVQTTAAGVATAAINPSWLMAETQQLSAERFRTELNGFFELQGDLWHYVELVNVHDGPESTGLEQFCLVFRGSMNDTVPEGIYSVKTPAGDSFLATIHPSGNENSYNYYVSYFSMIEPWYRRVLKRELRRSRREE